MHQGCKVMMRFCVKDSLKSVLGSDLRVLGNSFDFVNLLSNRGYLGGLT